MRFLCLELTLSVIPEPMLHIFGVLMMNLKTPCGNQLCIEMGDDNSGWCDAYGGSCDGVEEVGSARSFNSSSKRKALRNRRKIVCSVRDVRWAGDGTRKKSVIRPGSGN